MERRGRKIYRTRAGNRKRRTQKFFKALFMIIILAALVFVGYSVGKPIYKYFSERSGKDSAEETVPSVRLKTFPRSRHTSPRIASKTVSLIFLRISFLKQLSFLTLS